VNSSFDLDGFAEASMDFEDMDVVDYEENMNVDELATDRQPDNHLEDSESVLLDESSNQSLQLNDNENNKSDLDVMENCDPVRGLEREPSMRLVDVFNHSDVPQTPIQVASPKGPGELSAFLETGGTTNRLAGVRKWIKDKLDEQEENSNDRRKSLRDQEDESESSFSESVNQASGTNFGGATGWVPKSQPPV
jgi:hypothetical protein